MPKKKPMTGKPAVHPELQGMEIKINEFGEFTGNFDVNKINEFLNEKVEDKKLVERDNVLAERKKNSGKEIRIMIANFDNEINEDLQQLTQELSKAQMHIYQLDFKPADMAKMIRRYRKEHADIVIINAPSDNKGKLYPKITQAFLENDINDIMIIGFEDVNIEEDSPIYMIEYDDFHLLQPNDPSIVDFIRNWILNNRPF